MVDYLPRLNSHNLLNSNQILSLSSVTQEQGHCNIKQEREEEKVGKRNKKWERKLRQKTDERSGARVGGDKKG